VLLFIASLSQLFIDEKQVLIFVGLSGEGREGRILMALRKPSVSVSNI